MEEHVSKQDIQEVFHKLDKLTETLNDVKITVAVMKTRLEEHLENHKETASMFRRPVISGLIGAAFVAFGFIIKSAMEWIMRK